MREIYLKTVAELPVYSGQNLSLLNNSTLKLQCREAYWHYVEGVCEVTGKDTFKFKNILLRFLREVLPSLAVSVTPEEKKIMLDEAVLNYLRSGEPVLAEENLKVLGIWVQDISGSDYAVAKKLSFKPHKDSHAGLTAFTMQTDLFLLKPEGTESVSVFQGAGDPDTDSAEERLLPLLLQHMLFHPEKAEHTSVYAGYAPMKIRTDSLLKGDLTEPPETTVNRIINYMLTQTPKCGMCRYTFCEKRVK